MFSETYSKSFLNKTSLMILQFLSESCLNDTINEDQNW